MDLWSLPLFLALLLSVIAPCSPSPVKRVVAHGSGPGDLHYVFGDGAAGGVAVGLFEDTLNVTGWGVLDVKTDGQNADAVQAYAAGFVEGLLTAPRIYEHYLNLWQVVFGKYNQSEVELVKDWMRRQDQWTRRQVALKPSP